DDVVEQTAVALKILRARRLGGHQLEAWDQLPQARRDQTNLLLAGGRRVVGSHGVEVAQDDGVLVATEHRRQGIIDAIYRPIPVTAVASRPAGIQMYADDMEVSAAVSRLQVSIVPWA